MPRGVKGSGPAAPKKRGPKPREVLAAAAAVVAQAATAAQPQALPEAPAQVVASQSPEPVGEAPRGPGFGDSLQRGRRIDKMPEDELRAYARQIGITQRDAAGLSVERLRQNCSAQLYELIDAL